MKDEINEKVKAINEAEYAYTTTTDIADSDNLDFGCNGILMEGTILYLEIRNMEFIMKEYGKRAVSKIYKMYHTVVEEMVAANGGFVNIYAPDSFLIVFPAAGNNTDDAVKTALQLSTMLNECLPDKIVQYTPHIDFAIGIDHGHILGSKVRSDNAMEHMIWYGVSIDKAKAICGECSRPFFVGVSNSVYTTLDESLRIATKRLLGIKRKVEIWSKISYQFENVKHHMYQTNFHYEAEESGNQE